MPPVIDAGLAGRPAYLGARVTRTQDDRLLTGRGCYVADVQLPDVAEAAVVRSQAAHARLVHVDLSEARSHPGVMAAVAAGDLEGVQEFPHFAQWFPSVHLFPLCRDRLRYVGAPVAIVVAEDRYAAEDAAEHVRVEYEDLPVVASIDQALAPDAPRLFEEWPSNVVATGRPGDEEVDEIMAGSRVVSGLYRTQRHFGVPMETRAVAAEFAEGRLTVWMTSQMPHVARTVLSHVLGLPESRIRVIAPDVGGGFGLKIGVYPEYAVIAWLAMRLRRPIRWIEDRAEHMVSSVHARESVQELEAAVDDSGRILALRARITADVGSLESWPPTITPAFTTWLNLTGPYRVPVARGVIENVVTNKTPCGPYRGFGIPEGVFAMERLIEKIAREVDVDPIELRRSMLIEPSELPLTTPTGARLDSGRYREVFDHVVERAHQAENSARDRFEGDPAARIGLGVASYTESTTDTLFGTTGLWTSFDACTIRVEPDGGVVVGVGVMDTGNGAETAVAIVTAGALGVPLETVRVVMGDTDDAPYGTGAWGSRTAAVATGAIAKAAAAIRDKALRIAGHVLEVDPADLVIEKGQIHVRRSEGPSISFADVAQAATVRTVLLPPDVEPGLQANATYDPPNIQHWPDEKGRMNAGSTYAYATHAAIVKVDIETGHVEILDYLVGHDCGTVINVLTLEGQINGAVAQGIGGALYEWMAYSPEGQPLTTSFMDYLLPAAPEVPDLEIYHFETPAPDAAFGIKGAGEGGTVGPAAAIGNAVANALREFDVDVVATPLTPSAVRTLIRAER